MTNPKMPEKKGIDWQWVRALIGTDLLMLVIGASVILFCLAHGFLKWLGIILLIICGAILIYIVYNFIKWHDKKLEDEKQEQR